MNRIRQVAINTYHECIVCGKREKCIYMVYRTPTGQRKRIYVGEKCFLTTFGEQDESPREPVSDSLVSTVEPEPVFKPNDESSPPASERVQDRPGDRTGKRKTKR